MSKITPKDHSFPERHPQDSYELAIRGTNDGMWDWDITNEKVYYSPRWKEMLGYTENEIGDTPNEWLDRVHSSDIEQFNDALEACLKGQVKRFENEFRIRHKDGRYKWALARGMAVFDKGGKATRFVGTLTDITARKDVEQRLVHNASHDTLTGVPNRALFIDRVGQALSHRGKFAVLFIDIDHFKSVNDTLGHKVGDELLSILAKRVERSCRTGDTVARFGGDEFTVLLDNIESQEEVENFADRLIRDVGEVVTINGQKIFHSLSVGIALSFGGSYETAEEIINDADRAMYKAKEKGKGCYAVWGVSQTDKV